jgi:hypothetical protein
MITPDTIMVNQAMIIPAAIFSTSFIISPIGHSRLC